MHLGRVSDFELLTTHEVAWYIILVVSVSQSVCLSDDNFRKL